MILDRIQKENDIKYLTDDEIVNNMRVDAR